MARGKSSRHDAHGLSPSLTPRLFVPRPLDYVPSLPDYDLTPIEDRRRFHPLGQAQPARAFSGAQSPVVVKRGRGPRIPKSVSFAVPQQTVVCVRRQRRKEVLFAKNKMGRGKSRAKPRRSYWSSISCKR